MTNAYMGVKQQEPKYKEVYITQSNISEYFDIIHNSDNRFFWSDENTLKAYPASYWDSSHYAAITMNLKQQIKIKKISFTLSVKDNDSVSNAYNWCGIDVYDNGSSESRIGINTSENNNITINRTLYAYGYDFNMLKVECHVAHGTENYNNTFYGKIGNIKIYIDTGETQIVDRPKRIKNAYIGIGRDRYYFTQDADPHGEWAWEYVGLTSGIEFMDNEHIIIKEQQTGENAWPMNARGVTKRVEIEVTSSLQDFMMSCNNGTPSVIRGIGSFNMIIDCDGTKNDDLDIKRIDTADKFPEGKEPILRMWITPKNVAKKINKIYVGVLSDDGKSYAKLCYQV